MRRKENYYVFANTLTMLAATSGVGGVVCPEGDTLWNSGVTDNHECLLLGSLSSAWLSNIRNPRNGAGTPTEAVYYIDPHPLTSLNNEGHNYFLSQNPYTLNSYALFGELYHNITSDLKLTGGLRWTDDRKHFVDIPSELLVGGYGYLTTRRGRSTMEQVHRSPCEPIGHQNSLYRSNIDLRLFAARL